jgi:hypothetical protein
MVMLLHVVEIQEQRLSWEISLNNRSLRFGEVKNTNCLDKNLFKNDRKMLLHALCVIFPGVLAAVGGI